MQLTERCDIWRMAGTFDGGKSLQTVYTRVPCLRVPISSFDKLAAALVARSTAGQGESFRSEGRSSTDVFMLPTWVALQDQDELRRGRRRDITGRILQNIYTVDGIQSNGEGLGYSYEGLMAVFVTITR